MTNDKNVDIKPIIFLAVQTARRATLDTL